MTKDQFENIIKKRTKQHTNQSFKFFWASFALQILVYGLLSHVIVKNFGDGLLMLPAMLGITLYVPFTIVLMGKFKGMAMIKAGSINSYVEQQYRLLDSFYKFKRNYEMILIPVVTLIGTFITFQLYVPGFHLQGMMITFAIALVSCILAIREENKKSFDIPLSKLRMILDDLKA